MTLNCIIVDDEPLALDILEDYVGRVPELRLAGRFTDGGEALKRLMEGGVDLALLDIQMPGPGGLDVARAVEGTQARVIFTTAFPQYAIEGFRVDALDYLLKPVSFAEFSRAIERAVRSVASLSAPPAAPQSIVVKSDYRRVVVPLDGIVYVEGSGDYVRIHTTEGIVDTLMTMKSILALLPPARFVRVHRSYIVALDRIRRLERGRAILDEASLPVSDGYKLPLLHSLGDGDPK